MTQQDPRTQYSTPPQPEQQQNVPGSETEMQPKPDHGETSYRGSGKLEGRVALITGGDSGIGKAVAIAFAREGADVAIAYLNEDQDAQDTARYVEQAGKKALLIPGDIQLEQHRQQLVQQVVQQFGRIDILVNNAAFQMVRNSLDEVSTEEWDRTMRTNLYAVFWITKAAVPHTQPGAAIINTCSVNAYTPKPNLIAYSVIKAGIVNFTQSTAQLLAEKGIRVNSVAPGPVWTPLIPTTMPTEQVKFFGQESPIGRATQPAELAPVYVLLASQEASYISGVTVPVTGGTPTH